MRFLNQRIDDHYTSENELIDIVLKNYKVVGFGFCFQDVNLEGGGALAVYTKPVLLVRG